MPADSRLSSARGASDARAAQLAAQLEHAEQRLSAACAAAGRSRDAVTLIAVTKGHPAEDVRRLAALGIRDVAESRDQEAAAKVAASANPTEGPHGASRLRWHFVGRLQRNKVRSVVRYAAVVHTVDRAELVAALGDAVLAIGRPRLEVLVQVSLDDSVGAAPPSAGARGGAPPGEVLPLAGAIAAHPGLRLGGVMAVAPLHGSPDAAFERLAAVAAELRGRHAEATVISAGMSGDVEAAVAWGATHVRLGSLVLGPRPLLR